MALAQRLGLSKEPLYLIDGSSFFYRGYYAFQNLSRSDGFPTNALFSVLRLLLRLWREEKPSFVGFFMDGRGPNFRHELYPEYKANRQAMPEPLAMQKEPLLEAARLLGFSVTVSEGAEADDLIASLAARFKTERPVIILGSDKDLRQCLDENVFLFDPSGKQEKLVTLADFTAECGFAPENWPDFQALTGDSSDNIPGVPGIGPKTATEIMRQFKSLEEIQANFAKLSVSVQKKLGNHFEAAFTYRELTRLKTGLASEVTLDSLRPNPARRKEIVDFLSSYELRSLAREVSSGVLPEPAAPEKPKLKSEAGTQLSLFAPAKPNAPSQAKPQEAKLVSPEALPSPEGQELGLAPLENGAVLIGLAGQEYRLEELGGLEDYLNRAELVCIASYKEALEAKAPYAQARMEKFFDLSLAAYLLSPEESNYSFGRLRQSLEIENGEPGALGDGLACLELGRQLRAKLASSELQKLLYELELPLSRVLVRMQEAGIGIDLPAFGEFLNEVETELGKLTQRIHSLAGSEFNLRSSQQLAEILYRDKNMKGLRKTPGGAASTSSEVLEKLAAENPLAAEILEFRKLEKLRSTYLEPLPRLAGTDGRIRTTFNQTSTATGRLSSSGPNLQNIPIRGELGLRMRACFTAGPGQALVSADYSQIELRILAHFSKDPSLLAAFIQNEDIHARTAGLLFDKPGAEVSREERRAAKTINFGLLYGMGPQKLARELGIKLNQAKEFIERYFAKLTRLREFYNEVEHSAEERGYVTTLLGRRRLLPDIASQNQQLRAQAKRQAVNTVIQGSAADVIKLAMLTADSDPKLAALGSRLILQVHDELVLELPKSNAEVAALRIKDIMSQAVALEVPLGVDVGFGENWAEAH